MSQKGIQIENLAQVQRAIRGLGVPTKAMSNAGYEAGLIVIKEAQHLVPVRTGALKRSMKAAKLQRGVVVRAGNNQVPYANPIHWGWFRRGILPNPFFIKVLGYKAKDIYEAYFKQIDKAIAEAERTKA